MKKLIPFIFLALLATEISCYKSSNPSQSKIDEILAMKDILAQKSAFYLLTPSEKSDVWKLHLNSELKYNSYTIVQKKFISEVVENIDVKMFSPLTKNDFDGLIAKYAYRASILFDKNDYYNIFNTLGSDRSDTSASTITTMEIATEPLCSCNADGHPNFCTDNFLGGFVYCKKGNQNCKVSNSGCGWFWVNECNGRCEVVITLPLNL